MFDCNAVNLARKRLCGKLTARDFSQVSRLWANNRVPLSGGGGGAEALLFFVAVVFDGVRLELLDRFGELLGRIDIHIAEDLLMLELGGCVSRQF